MRAAEGAVDTVKIEDGKIQCHVIGEGKPKGICGSGIIDLLAELFLNGWINLFGTLQPERSEKIKEDPETGEWVLYAADVVDYLKLSEGRDGSLMRNGWLNWYGREYHNGQHTRLRPDRPSGWLQFNRPITLRNKNYHPEKVRRQRPPERRARRPAGGAETCE